MSWKKAKRNTIDTPNDVKVEYKEIELYPSFETKKFVQIGSADEYLIHKTLTKNIQKYYYIHPIKVKAEVARYTDRFQTKKKSKCNVQRNLNFFPGELQSFLSKKAKAYTSKIDINIDLSKIQERVEEEVAEEDEEDENDNSEVDEEDDENEENDYGVDYYDDDHDAFGEENGSDGG